jgi:peptidoglycan/xylan/chitin deacetylase (PgdA/CDA1 family)
MPKVIKLLLLCGLLAGPAPTLQGGDPASQNLPSAPPPISLIFRFDDYSAKSDTALEEKVLAAFARRGVPLTVSVIPEVASGSAFDPSPQEGLALGEDKALLLRHGMDTGGVEVALHGYSHQTVRRKIGSRFLEPFGRYHSEFIGVDEATQEKKIRAGRDLLERQLGIRAAVFVPPWNGYDLTTLRVLARCGFTAISAARRGPVDLASPLRFLPSTSDLWELKDAVGVARESREDSPIVVVLFHHYDFLESDPKAGHLGLPDLERLLDWVVLQKDLRLLTLGGAARALPDLGPRQFYWNRNALLWQVTPPWAIVAPGRPPRGVYLSLSAARRAKLVLWSIVILLYGGVLLAAGCLARFASGILLKGHPALRRAAQVLSGIAFLAIVLYVFWDLEPYWMGVAAISCTGGFGLGLL